MIQKIFKQNRLILWFILVCNSIIFALMLGFLYSDIRIPNWVLVIEHTILICINLFTLPKLILTNENLSTEFKKLLISDPI